MIGSSQRAGFAAVGAGLALALGCVMPDDLSKIQKDVADVQQQLLQVRDGQTEIERQLAALASQENEDSDQVTREELADVQLRLDRFSGQMSVSTERMNDVEQRFDRYSQELQQTRELARSGAAPLEGEGSLPYEQDPGALPVAGSSRPTNAATTPDPEALYNTAYADFSKGNYALAIGGFQEYQQRFPDSALADNALYWIAECHFSQADYGAAVDALDNLLDRYPDSDKAPAANLKKALSFQEQNQIQQAIIQYRYVVTAFPGTDEARLAEDKLSGLGAAAD